MTVSKLSIIAPFLITFLLSACQTMPTTQIDVQDQQDMIRRIPSWQAEGKIALQMGDDRQSAAFDWQQQRANYVIHLYGPFGQGTTWLRRTSKGVSLENAEIGRRHASDAEQLMQDSFGWQVPVSNLQYWIRGLIAPKPPADETVLDEIGLISQLDQEGWHVTYVKYGTYNGWQLPTKLTAERESIKVTIVVKNWQISMAPAF